MTLLAMAQHPNIDLLLNIISDRGRLHIRLAGQ